MVGGQFDGPDRPQQVSDDDVLFGLGAPAQFGAGRHRSSSIAVVSISPSGSPTACVTPGRCSNAYTSTAPWPASAAQPLCLVQCLSVLPHDLEHDVATVAIDAGRDRGAVAARLERVAEVQPQRAVNFSTRSGSAASHCTRGPPASVEACR